MIQNTLHRLWTFRRILYHNCEFKPIKTLTFTRGSAVARVAVAQEASVRRVTRALVSARTGVTSILLMFRKR